MKKEEKPRCFRHWSTPGAELCSACTHDRDCFDATDRYWLRSLIGAPKCFTAFGSIFDCPICKYNQLCRKRSGRARCFGEHSLGDTCWYGCTLDGLCERYHLYTSIENVPDQRPVCFGYVGEVIMQNDDCESCEHTTACQAMSELRKEDENPSCLGQLPRTRTKCWTCRHLEQCNALIQVGHKECFGQDSPFLDWRCAGCDEEMCDKATPSYPVTG